MRTQQHHRCCWAPASHGILRSTRSDLTKPTQTQLLVTAQQWLRGTACWWNYLLIDHIKTVSGREKNNKQAKVQRQQRRRRECTCTRARLMAFIANSLPVSRCRARNTCRATSVAMARQNRRARVSPRLEQVDQARPSSPTFWPAFHESGDENRKREVLIHFQQQYLYRWRDIDYTSYHTP